MDSSQPSPEQNAAELPASEAQSASAPRPRRTWRKLRFGPPFWTIASVISLVVNIILIVAVISLGTQLFALKRVIQDQVLAGLYQNFILMDQAHIQTTIPITTSVPAKFDLPLKTNTEVVLTQPTLLENAKVARLTTGGLTITNAPATIELAAGTRLPVALDLVVPVDQMIPVSLNVNVDIPLSQTQLHQPFVGLQEVVRPYYRIMKELPDNWGQALCGEPDSLPCQLFH